MISAHRAALEGHTHSLSAKPRSHRARLGPGVERLWRANSTKERVGSMTAGRLPDRLESTGHAAPGGLIGRLQGHRDIPSWREKQRHVDPNVTDREGLDISRLHGRPGVVGDECQGFVGRGWVELAPKLGPDGGVNALGIARRPRMQVNQEYVVP